MLPKTSIEDILKDLQILYDNHPDNNHKIYFSKLALLELCGWIELAHDEIIKNYSDTKLTIKINKDEIEKIVIAQTYGFSYKSHFRPMVIKLIVFHRVEILESNLNSDILILKAQLGDLYKLRNKAAHTPTIGEIPTYQSPSSMLGYLNSLHTKLTNFEIELLNF